MFQRVDEKKPFYQNQIWKKEREKNLVYLSNISRYPDGSNGSSFVSQRAHSVQRAHSAQSVQRTHSIDSTFSESMDLGKKLKIGMTRSVLLRQDYLQKKIQQVKKDMEKAPNSISRMA